MNIRFLFAVWVGKSSSLLLRITGSGGGALPGLLSSKIDPTILSTLGKRGPQNLVLICGTNGKTTTSRMIAEMIDPKLLIHNRSGSNLTRGHIAAYLEKTSWLGQVKASYAILEVDEAVLPYALKNLKPSSILLHNLFRDQLDRYGEVNAIATKWLEALKQAPQSCTLIINADDPNLAYIGTQLPSKSISYYGLADPSVGTTAPSSPLDTYLSPSDNKPLTYSAYYLSHLGDYHSSSGFKKPELDFSAQSITLSSTSSFTVKSPKLQLPVTLGLPGIYNIYNGLAASVLGIFLGIAPEKIQATLQEYSSAFGRFEKISYKGRQLTLCLIKNPAGATEVLRTINLDFEPFNLLIFTHDNFADGLDVSWYWDTPYEISADKPEMVLCAGKRAADMALRLKYAQYPEPIAIHSSLEKALEAIPENSKNYILTTYTASLELQHILQKKGVKKAYWKE